MHSVPRYNEVTDLDNLAHEREKHKRSVNQRDLAADARDARDVDHLPTGHDAYICVVLAERHRSEGFHVAGD